mgnify:CR=1 FL=1
MKKLLLIVGCLLAVQSAWAQKEGGLNESVAPPPPHKIEDGYRGTEDARIMTVEFAKTLHDGATISLRGNLIEHIGDDRYVFRDKSGSIGMIIPTAVFDGREVKPDQMLSINGSLDKKMTPPIVRVDLLQK